MSPHTPAFAVLDSFHFRFQNLDSEGKSVIVKNEEGDQEYTYYEKPVSFLDMLLAKCYSGIDFEKGTRKDGSEFEIGKIDFSNQDSYSAPFATTLFDKTQNQEGKWVNEKLKYVDKQKTKQRRHWLGTDKAGGDIFYKLMKGIRTALVVGLVATMLVIPLSMILWIAGRLFRRKSRRRYSVYLYNVKQCAFNTFDLSNDADSADKRLV